jgi:O-acetyl-ADP-ribose deacetylase (regulator of RNase III)
MIITCQWVVGFPPGFRLPAGQDFRNEAKKQLPLKLGDVAVTSAGKLHARYVFHAVTIDFDKNTRADHEVIRAASKRCMELADSLRCRTIVFPALGTGAAGFPFEPCAEAMVGAIVDHLNRDTALEIVSITLLSRRGVGSSDPTTQFYEKAVGVASVGTANRSLQQVTEEVRKLISGMNKPELKRKFDEFYTALSREDSRLDRPSVYNSKDTFAEKVFSKTTELAAATREAAKDTSWETEELKLKLLNTRYAGCMAQLNIKASHLNSFEIARAKYGGIDIPPRLESAIGDLRSEIVDLENQAHQLRQTIARSRSY